MDMPYHLPGDAIEPPPEPRPRFWELVERIQGLVSLASDAALEVEALADGFWRVADNDAFRVAISRLWNFCDELSDLYNRFSKGDYEDDD